MKTTDRSNLQTEIFVRGGSDRTPKSRFLCAGDSIPPYSKVQFTPVHPRGTPPGARERSGASGARTTHGN
jgi:hypothetical protein